MNRLDPNFVCVFVCIAGSVPSGGCDKKRTDPYFSTERMIMNRTTVVQAETGKLAKRFKNQQVQNLTQVLCVGLLVFAGYSFTAVPVAGIEMKPERKSEIETNEQGYVTRMLWQPNEEHGAFELKQTDRDGKVAQWYQHFVDEDGKALIDIIRDPLGQGLTFAYESIRIIRYNTYRPDGNISEFYEYTGDGVLRQRVKYKYDQNGNWVEGIIYNDKGKQIGKELTPPEARLYGARKARK